MALLELSGVDVSYGGVEALRAVSLHVDGGELVALLGGNGAGKTTTLATVSGLVRPSAGAVRFAGQDITRSRPATVVGAGVSHVPEGRRVFAALSVHENLLLGGYLVRGAARLGRRVDRVYQLLPRLAQRRHQPGGTLSGGEQQLLAIGRALVAEPRLLMLDEPSMGLAPMLVAAVLDLVRDVHAAGTAVLLVEQNARAALRIADRGYVLDRGQVSLAGPAAELARDPAVVAAYLGG